MIQKDGTVTRYRPVPRTLSDIMKRLPPRRRNAPELISPEELRQSKASLLEPEALFKSVTARPSHSEQTRQEIGQQGMRQPGQLFGPLQLATPGQKLSSPQELDLLPGLSLAKVVFEPLPEPAEIFKDLPTTDSQAADPKSELKPNQPALQKPMKRSPTAPLPPEPGPRYKRRPPPPGPERTPPNNQSSTR